ncbi:hypothetical protein EYF80_051053 [Liparis tanakae]|uniref:Uncharacterized protein n=1 Tax=Liparis tanakae TaxID=230148 RepID=A0A4Z2FC72_9TELE|nr:hypothetical protein EYF80_051053 [Liparis tanakae]
MYCSTSMVTSAGSRRGTGVGRIAGGSRGKGVGRIAAGSRRGTGVGRIIGGSLGNGVGRGRKCCRWQAVEMVLLTRWRRGAVEEALLRPSGSSAADVTGGRQHGQSAAVF